jgi:hypothetical protein
MGWMPISVEVMATEPFSVKLPLFHVASLGMGITGQEIWLKLLKL